jgi:hypothetical protein
MRIPGANGHRASALDHDGLIHPETAQPKGLSARAGR